MGAAPLLILIALTTGACTQSPQAREARFIKRGKEAMKKKDFSKASLEFRNAVQVAPRDAEAWYQLGESYLAAGAFQQSAAALRKATELNPKHVEAQLQVSGMMAASRDLKAVGEAQDRLTGILGLAPDNPDILDILALVHLRLGKSEQAEEELTRALAKLPSHLQSSVDLAKFKLVGKDVAGARRVLEEAVKANPQSAAAALVLGRFYLVSGEPDRGEAEVRRALRIDPKNGPALLTLAERLYGSGRVDEAERTYLEISQLPDKNYKPLHAAFLFQTGRRETAIAEFKKLAQESPNDREARTRLVAALVTAGKTSDAESELKAALQKNPDDTEALLQQGRLFLSSRRYTDAENDLRRVLHFQPDSGQAHFYLAKVYQARGASLNQRQELAEAVRADPGFLAARTELAELLIASRENEAALQTMNETPDAQRRTPAAIETRNWALLALGGNDAARKGVDEGLAIARAPELLLQDAALKLAGKDLAGAQASIDEALKLVPDSVSAWEFLRRDYAARKQPQIAIERLRAVAAQRPQSAALQLLLGRWLADAGLADEARKAYEAGKKADPKSTEAEMALAQLDMRQGSMDSARRHLEAVVAGESQNIAARVLLAEIAKKAGDTKGAIDQYRAILSLDDHNLVALNDLAFILCKDNPDEALKFAQQAGELAPDNPAVEDTLGWIYYRNGVYKSAVHYLKTAVEQDSTPRRKYHLGMAYLRSGDRDLGRQMVQAALEAEPTLAASEGR